MIKIIPGHKDRELFWCSIPEVFGNTSTSYEALNIIAQQIEISKQYLGSELDEELFNV